MKVMNDLNIFYACFNVSNSKEMLEKLQGGLFDNDEQDLLEDALLDRDLSIRELMQLLYNDMFNNSPIYCN